MQFRKLTKVILLAGVLSTANSCTDSLPGAPPIIIPPGPNGNILYSAANTSDPDKSELMLVDSFGINRGTLGPGFLMSEPGRDRAAWTIFRGLFATDLWAGPTSGGTGAQVSPIFSADELLVHGSAAISPDGRRVAFSTVNLFSGNTKLYYYESSNGIAPTPNFIANDIAFNSVPSFSPDGNKIAYFTQQVDAVGEPIIGSQGFEIADITTSLPTFDDLTSMVGAFEVSGLETIDWSPNGEELLFSAGGIQYHYVDGSLPISSYIHGTFSPDGNRIAYISADGQLYIEDRLGQGGRLQLTAAVDSVAFFPSWSPDGKKIVYTSISTVQIEEFNGSIKTVDVADPNSVTQLVGGNSARAFWLRR